MSGHAQDIEPRLCHAEPAILILGDGPYAAALATVLKGIHLPAEQLHGDPPLTSVEHQPWRDLKQAILVVGEYTSAPENLQHHERVWEWLKKLSPDRDQHNLAFIFVLPPHGPERFDQVIASSLCLTVGQLPANGHAIWRRSGTLWELLDVIQQVAPKDFLYLEARRQRDARRPALRRLLSMASQADAATAADSARAVLDAFGGSIYDLDQFCRYPHNHSYGNQLRKWLKEAVTGPVSEAWLDKGRERLLEWLEGDIQPDSK